MLAHREQESAVLPSEWIRLTNEQAVSFQLPVSQSWLILVFLVYAEFPHWALLCNLDWDFLPFLFPPSPPPPSSSVQQSWPHSNRGNEQHLVRLILRSCKQCKLTAVSGISSSSGVEKKSITHPPIPHLLVLAPALVLQDNCLVHFPENILESHPLYRGHSSMQM